MDAPGVGDHTAENETAAAALLTRSVSVILQCSDTMLPGSAFAGNTEHAAYTPANG